MRGDINPQTAMFSYVSPESRVPATHPLGQLNAMSSASVGSGPRRPTHDWSRRESPGLGGASSAPAHGAGTQGRYESGTRAPHSRIVSTVFNILPEWRSRLIAQHLNAGQRPTVRTRHLGMQRLAAVGLLLALLALPSALFASWVCSRAGIQAAHSSVPARWVSIWPSRRCYMKPALLPGIKTRSPSPAR